MLFLRPCGSKRQSRADGLALEALLEEVTVATVLAVVVVDVAAGYALDGFSHGLFALSDEQVEVV